MIDIFECNRKFDIFLKNYDLNNFKQNLKKNHTKRVVNRSYEIALSLNLKDEDVKLAELIGLLHDIGRFEQIKLYDMIDDKNSVNHAELGVSILEEENYLENYLKDSINKKIVLKSILNHNKFKIEDNLDEITLMFSKIIRDADKLDILYLYQTGELNIEHDMGKISDACYLDFINNIQVKSENIISEIDAALARVSYIFDFNYSYTYKYAKDNNLFDYILNNLIEKNETDKEKLNEIKKIVNNKLERGIIC